MGAADIVPGVSGGTVAFITGIYEELISSIKSVDVKALGLLLKGKFKDFIEKINLYFLLALGGGIVTAILLLSKFIKYLLLYYTHLLWAFFFGLVIASIHVVGRHIQKWTIKNLLALVLGTLIAYFVVSLSMNQSSEPSLLYIFFAGAVAISAMLLPGISGSFLLVIMGVYHLIIGHLQSITEGAEHIYPILIFIAGMLLGLVSFSRAISWAFQYYHEVVVSFLIGFMVGALPKLWPWKLTTKFYTNTSGEKIPLQQVNILPSKFEEFYDRPAQTALCIGLMLIAFVVVAILGRSSKKD